MLLIGCYLAILIPAYLPLDKVAAIRDDYQQPKDMVQMHLCTYWQASEMVSFPFFRLKCFSLCSGRTKSVSLSAGRTLSASLVSKPPQAPVLSCWPPRYPRVCTAGEA